ncbi:MAG: ComF family protein [Bacteroidaceae bacterium]|nr:ComF family protein [Bacteroidaceae bacterium]
MKWISDLIDIIFPRCCAVCGTPLSSGEKELCINCMIDMPLTEPYRADNEMEKQFFGIIQVERAAAYMHYGKESPYNNIIHRMKYKDRPEIGKQMAAKAAKELIGKGFFHGIDIIVPLPLSAKKKRSRGYNQCDYIAQGISETTGIPIDNKSVIRHIANETQTHKRRDERWKNAENIFRVTTPEALAGKHILLIDDVLTTGATIASCGKSILTAVPDARLSIFTLSRAGKSI